MPPARRRRPHRGTLPEVLHRARAAGGDQRHFADLAHPTQLLQIVTVAHAVTVHHVQHDLTGAAALHFLHPVEGFPLGDAGAALVAGILIDVILAGSLSNRIDAHHDALHAKAIRQAANQIGIGQRR